MSGLSASQEIPSIAAAREAHISRTLVFHVRESAPKHHEEVRG